MNAWQLFYDTLAVVSALMVWPAIFVIAGFIGNERESYRNYRNYKAEEAARRGPYTKAELRRVPNDRMLEIVLFNGDKIVYRKGLDKP